METKTFEHVLEFFEVSLPNGSTWLPIITVNLIQPTGTRVALPLLFDTGASVTTLREDLYPLLGVTSWNAGTPLQVATGGAVIQFPRISIRRKLNCLAGKLNVQ
jgi:hypothetical protein